MHSILKFYVFLWKNKGIFFFFLTIVPLIGLLSLNNYQKKAESDIHVYNYDLSNFDKADYSKFNSKIEVEAPIIKVIVSSSNSEIAKEKLKQLNQEILTDISYDILKQKKAELKTQSLKVTSLLDKKQTLQDMNKNNKLEGAKLKVYQDELDIIEQMYKKELVEFQHESLEYESFNLDDYANVDYIEVEKPNYFGALMLLLVLGFIVALVVIIIRDITHKTLCDELEIKKHTGIRAFVGLSKVKKMKIENNALVAGGLKIHKLTEISRIFKFISQRDKKVFEVVSSFKGEGNSSLTQALAEHAASNNHKVLLVDLNLKNMDLSVSITKTLENWDITAKDFSNVDDKVVALSSNLDFLPALKDQQSLEVLKVSKNLKEFVKYLSAKYDYIFFDTTAVYSVNIHNLDSVVLAGVVDGVIVNYLAHKTAKKKLMSSIENLRMAESNILCIVTNNRYNPRLKQELLAFCTYLEYFNKSIADSLRVKILKSSLLDEE